MGKHERHKAEICEYLISKALEHNENVLSEMVDENYIKLSIEIIDRITEDYGVDSVQKVGNDYDSIGDIMINANSGKVFVEIKITESGGTLGNISQDALTNYGIIREAMSWSEFRSEKNHYDWVEEYLNRFDYPDSVREDDTKTSIYDRAKYLKNEINCGRGKKTENVARRVLSGSNDQDETTAARIILDIIDRAKKQRKEYIRYLSDKQINEEKLRKFTYLLLSGYATEDDIRERLDMSIHNIDGYDKYDYVVYNGYKDSMEVNKEDKNERVEILLGEKDVDIKFPEGQSGFNVTVDGKKVLRAQFHWKNKFQGIETPCINIFYNK